MIATQAEPGKFLTPADAAHSLGCHPSALVRWMTKGALLRDGSRLRLQHVRLPGSFRTTREWLDAFLQAIADDRAGKPIPAAKPSAKTARVERMNAALQAAGLIGP